ncbi:MAG TPA: hypothetical protein PKE26_15490 [Kiritimatiellia bacterium]|nr:hypothetical protein [Kiritimatiellia bacterium]HMP00498.1 hypothetical protein [Kiritimatiellia bacterium]HMP96402.1 hypothetical protein [Kiritimatiellia bacterium]
METPAPSRSTLQWVYGILTVVLVAHLLTSVSGRDGFSWMDPYQYYHAARELASGESVRQTFTVASTYPAALSLWLRIRADSAFALSSHAVWLAGLAWAIYRLSVRAGIPALAPLVLGGVMAAPAVFGLSRELYLEFPLTALVALHYALWFRRPEPEAGDATPAWYWPIFGMLMAIGFSIKMTYPIFLAGPMLLEAIGALRARRTARAVSIAACLLLPVLLVVGLAYAFFPEAFRYYRSLGNTVIPSMRLIGPPDWFSSGASWFYLDQVFRNYLLWLCPAALLFIWYARGDGSANPAVRLRRDLWLWLAIPLVVFTFMPVREPRHIAPVAVPLLLLTTIGLSTIRGVAVRRLVLVAFGLAAIFQYALIATGKIAAPYHLNRPMKTEKILANLFMATPDAERYLDEGGQPDAARWRYTRSLLISGFAPNEALAVTWVINPAVVMDLDAYDDPKRRQLPHAYQTFTDLYLVTAFNHYNHRCGWPGHYETLSREEALAAADALLIATRPGHTPAIPPGFRPAGMMPWGPRDSIAFFVPETPPAKSFRRLYAEKFLLRNPDAPEAELNAIFQELMMDGALRDRLETVSLTRPLFPPGFQPGGALNNIYFLPGYAALREESARRIATVRSALPAAEPETPAPAAP